jgi:uroporphyrinogen-III synthase
MSERPNAASVRLALSGKRVLITRATGQASDLVERLSAMGAKAILIPAIEIGPPASFAVLDAALATLDDFDLVVFTSANAVEAFQQRALHLGVTPAPRRIAVVGPATAHAVEAIGLHPDVVPPVYTAESLAEALLPEAPGQLILLVLVEQAPATLHNALLAAGARVMVVAAYSNRVPEGSLEAVAKLFADPAGLPDAVTFTSSSTARNLVALLESARLTLPDSVARVSIGPITSSTLRDLGLPPHIEASEPTIAALADALAAHFRAIA